MGKNDLSYTSEERHIERRQTSFHNGRALLGRETPHLVVKRVKSIVSDVHLGVTAGHPFTDASVAMFTVDPSPDSASSSSSFSTQAAQLLPSTCSLHTIINIIVCVCVCHLVVCSGN